jgi:hypothetical protein
MGRWAKWGLKMLTFWDTSMGPKDYIFSNCYKVISQDPEDEIINDAASMKTGVSLEIISHELK